MIRSWPFRLSYWSKSSLFSSFPTPVWERTSGKLHQQHTFSTLLCFQLVLAVNMNALKTRWNTSWSTYQRVDSSEELLEKAGQEPGHDSRHHATTALRSYRRLIVFQWGAIISLLICTSVLLLALVLKRPEDKECGIKRQFGVSEMSRTSLGRRLNYFFHTAPAVEAIEYENIEIENGFSHESPYRGPPTPELEAAWEKLWRCMSEASIRRDTCKG